MKKNKLLLTIIAISISYLVYIFILNTVHPIFDLTYVLVAFIPLILVSLFTSNKTAILSLSVHTIGFLVFVMFSKHTTFKLNVTDLLVLIFTVLSSAVIRVYSLQNRRKNDSNNEQFIVEQYVLRTLQEELYDEVKQKIVVFNADDFIISYANRSFLASYAKDKESIAGEKIGEYIKIGFKENNDINDKKIVYISLNTFEKGKETEFVSVPLLTNHGHSIMLIEYGREKNTGDEQVDLNEDRYKVSQKFNSYFLNLINNCNEAICIYEFPSIVNNEEFKDETLSKFYYLSDVRYYNNAFIKLLKTNRTTSGQNISDLFINRDLSFWKEIIKKLLDTNFIEINHTVQTTDGLAKSVSTKFSAIRDEQNYLSGFTAITTDVSKQKSLETDLNSAIQLFVKSIDSIVDQVYVIDTNCNIKLLNKSAIQFCTNDESEEELIGQNIFTVLDIINNDEENIASVFETRRTLIKEDSFAYKLQKQTFKKQFIPVLKNDKVSKMIIIISEITKDQIAKRALIRIKAQQNALLDNIPHIAWLKDINGVYISVNEPFAKYQNKKISEIKGKTDFDIMSERLALKLEKSENIVIETMTQHTVIEPFASDTGNIWLEITRTPIFNDKGEVIGTTGLALDITERKLAEEALKESEERFRQLAENLKEVFWLVDWDNDEVLYLSPAFKAVFGISERDVYDDFYNWFSIIHQEDKQKVYDLYVNGAHKGLFDIEYRIVKENFDICWIRNRAFPVYDSVGSVTRIAGIADDITELNHSQNQLQKLNETLEQRVTERTTELEQEIHERIQFETALRESEGLFRGYFELGPLGMAITSPDTSWLKVNKTLTDIFGYSEDELLNSKWSEITHPDDYKDEMIHFLTLLEGQITGYHLEKRFFHKEGHLIHTMLYVRGVYDDSNKIKSVLMLLQDISETKKTQAILDNQLLYEKTLARCSQILLREDISPEQAINSTLEELYLTTNSDRIYIYENYTDFEDGLCSKLVYESTSPDLKNELDTPEVNRICFDTDLHRWKDLMLNKEVVTGFVSDLPEDERDHYTSRNVKSFLNIPLIVDGNWEGFVGFENIVKRRAWSKYEIDMLQTAADMIVAYIGRKKAEKALDYERASLAKRVAERTRELSSANSQLAKASRLKDEFLASMSHELRTPLNAILGLSEALTDQVYGPLNEDHLSTLHTIEESGRHLLDLINDILDLSKIDAGKFSLDITNVNVISLCDSSIRFVKQASLEKGIQIHSEYDESVEIFRVDQRRVKQIVVNLLSNAVKFTPEGGKVFLKVKGDRENQQIKLIVQDTGIGIAEEDMSKLFAPFVQLDSSLARRHGGTGLGLSLARKLVELHGGSIQVESIVNEGSTFTVVLPWNKNYQQNEEFSDENSENIGNLNKSVAVYTDNNDSLDLLMKHLNNFEFKDIEYYESNTELSKILNKSIDFLIINVDDDNICEIINNLSEEIVNENICILILSNYVVDTSDVKYGKSLNLQIPISNERIVNAFNQLFGLKNIEDDIANISGAANMQTTQQKTILLAEDNENNINMIYDYLTAKEFLVVVARNGLEALDLLNECTPDLILMDIQMPEMDGLQATEYIRQSEKYNSVPVIALTALAMQGDRERCLASGANDYLTKPVSLKNLVKTINTYINKED